MNEQAHVSRLKRILSDKAYFTESDLREGCFKLFEQRDKSLGIDCNHIPGDNQLEKAERLIAHASGRGLIRELEEVMRQINPHAFPQLLSEDGTPLTKDDEHRPAPPRESFDPQHLDTPTGAVSIRDTFYIERDGDPEFKRQLLSNRSITTIRGPRQTGKSSLLVRGLHFAREQQAKIIRIDLQEIDPRNLQSREAFLYYLAQLLVRKLRLDRQELKTAWQGTLGPQDKLNYFMEDYILYKCCDPIVLMIDEADRLLETDFHSDFFALMRAWHNKAAYEEEWERLKIALVISTEPHLLIADLTQSPFNVGLKLYLHDFSLEQVDDLNQRHGSPLRNSDLSQMMDLLNGHPYLTRQAFYLMVTQSLSWSQLKRLTRRNEGPFAEHLRHQWHILRARPELRKALRQMMSGALPEELILYTLSRAGLIKGSGENYSMRCGLYQQYFEKRLCR